MPAQEHKSSTGLATAPLSAVLIGALLTDTRLTASTVLDKAARAGLGIAAAARAVLDLVDRGLASVMRENDEGELIATPAIEKLAQPYRVHCIVANLANAKLPAPAVHHA